MKTREDFVKEKLAAYQQAGKTLEIALAMALGDYFDAQKKGKGVPENERHVFKNLPRTQKAYSADEVKALCAAVGVEYEEGDEEKVIEFVASDEKADREGDVMQMSGMDTTDFMTNPQFLYVHDYYSIPIGNVIKLAIDKSDSTNAKLLITVLFHTVTPEANDLFTLAKKGVLKAVSIGFRAKMGGIKYPTEAEREALNMRPGGVIFLAWELFEVSLCPVGMNPRALKKAELHQKTFAMFEKQKLINIEDSEIDMTKEEFETQLTKSLGGLAKLMDGVILFAGNIKAGDKVTAEHVAAIHGAHGALSKALTHIGKVMQDHPTAIEAGQSGGVFTEGNEKSLGHAMDNCAKAIVHMKMIGAAHEADPTDEGEEDAEKSAASILAFAKKNGYVPEEKNEFQIANERLHGAAA